jgi:RNA polymerase sigma-32 factor
MEYIDGQGQTDKPLLDRISDMRDAKSLASRASVCFDSYAGPQAKRTNNNALDANFIRRIMAVPMLSAEEERSLFARFRRGDQDAGDRIILAHLKMVPPTARKITRETSGRIDRENFSELVAAGSEGLKNALRRFKPDCGARFSTAARYSIAEAIRSQMRLLAGDIKTPRGKPFQKQTSLQTPWTNDEGKPSELIEKFDGDPWLMDERSQQALIDEMGVTAHLRERLTGLLASALSDRERIILEARFLSDKPTTLEVLATKFGISGERVRQIEAKALEKVKRAAKKHCEGKAYRTRTSAQNG